MNLRRYETADRSACLAIFDSNCPLYFATHERQEFADYLDQSTDPYFVVEADDGAIIGCGGIAFFPNQVGELTWGMVDNARHKQGAGRFLLRARLAELRQAGMEKVVINTSQHTQAFFAKEGFVVEEIKKDGFTEGLDEYKMVLRFE